MVSITIDFIIILCDDTLDLIIDSCVEERTNLQRQRDRTCGVVPRGLLHKGSENRNVASIKI